VIHPPSNFNFGVRRHRKAFVVSSPVSKLSPPGVEDGKEPQEWESLWQNPRFLYSYEYEYCSQVEHPTAYDDTVLASAGGRSYSSNIGVPTPRSRRKVCKVTRREKGESQPPGAGRFAASSLSHPGYKSVP
jgi:hypothetical protein